MGKGEEESTSKAWEKKFKETRKKDKLYIKKRKKIEEERQS